MIIFRILTFLTFMILLLAACGGSDELPPLAEAGQPTLVFIYTDN